MLCFLGDVVVLDTVSNRLKGAKFLVPHGGFREKGWLSVGISRDLGIQLI